MTKDTDAPAEISALGTPLAIKDNPPAGAIGPHCPINLLDSDPFTPYVRVLWTTFDDDGFEQGERINGFDQCPKCGLWSPCVEEPDMWEQGADGRWYASGWWGGNVCEECGLLIVCQPDGTPECYDLNAE